VAVRAGKRAEVFERASTLAEFVEKGRESDEYKVIKPSCCRCLIQG
jgi:hypothetical protein